MSERRLAPRARTRDALMPGDTIEFSLTEEVSPGPGRKAWVKFGTVSSVRGQESTEEAVERVHRFVAEGLDERIEALGD